MKSIRLILQLKNCNRNVILTKYEKHQDEKDLFIVITKVSFKTLDKCRQQTKEIYNRALIV